MRRHTDHPARTLSGFRRAFTVVELLVVVVIILIVLTVATPAFQSMIYSAARSDAANTVNAAAIAARELALRSASGDDGAVVFVFDRDGTTRVIPAVRVGSIREPVFGAGGTGPGGASPIGEVTVLREVFAPVAQFAGFQMPAFWNVRGYAAPNTMVDFVLGRRPELNAVWYNSALYGGLDTNSPAKQDGNWVFPETAFYDLNQAAAAGEPTARQSFMIRFDSRTGAVSSNTAPVLFVDPRPSTAGRPGGERPQARQRWLRPDRAEDLGAWARGLIKSPPINNNGDPISPPFTEDANAVLLSFIGVNSNDTVLVKPVTRIAVYDERRMARDLGARRLNAETNSLYQPVARGSNAVGNQIDASLFGGTIQGGPEGLRRRMNNWINGDTNNDGRIDDDDAPQARVYLVRPGTGELTEVLR